MKKVRVRNKQNKWIFRLGGFEATYWAAYSAAMFRTVFLENLGYSVSEVSLINSIGSAISIVSTPIGGAFGDKLRSTAKAHNLFLLGAIITSALVPLTSNVKIFGFPLFVLFLLLSIFFLAPTSTLMETTVINGAHNTGTFFGFVRSWGSLSWVITCLILGAVIVEENAYITFYLLAILFIPCLYFASSLREVSDKGGKNVVPLKFSEMPFDKLFKNPYYIAYIIFVIFQHIPQNSIGTFQPYLLKEMGNSMGYVGYIQAYRAAFEIPMLLLSNKLVKKISYRTMVILSALFWALQGLTMSFITSFWMLIAVTTLSGIASGFTQAGSIRFVMSLAPNELQATAQTLAASVSSIAGIAGNLIGGLIIEASGIRNYYLISGIMMLIVSVLYTLSFIFIKNVLKTEFVDYSRITE
ncbi:MAG: MFS transporter [Clostridia bacterium]|nr:MFS transporter [Clostridia bacterium]